MKLKQTKRFLMITRYSWQQSAINHLDFGQNLSGNHEATLFVSDTAAPEKLANLRHALSELGIASYLDAAEGKTLLKIVGYKNEEALLSLLSSQGLVNGPAEPKALSDDGKKRDLWQKVRENGTNIAGVLGMAGHAALIASGAIAHEKERVLAGLQYGTSAGILAVYGSGHEEKIPKLCSGLRDHLAHEGITLSGTAHLTPVDAYRQRTMLQKGHDAFKANSILAANLIGVGGNFSMLKSGYDVAKREGVMMGLGRGAHGAINLAGAGVASFVEEKDPEQIAAEKEKGIHKDRGLFGNVKDLIARAPLAFQGSIFLVDNIATNYDAYNIRKRYFQRQKTEHVPLPQMPAGIKEGSNIEKAWKKAYKEVLQEAGHPQRLAENWSQLTATLEKIPGAATLERELATAAHDIPSIEQCLSKIKTINGTVGHHDALKGLFAERKLLLQELEEVQKYPRGWWLAAAKAGAWTLSSAFQAIATKNRGTTPEQKYGELAAQVATMALEVPAEQRETVIRKSAEYLASKDFVHLRSEELAGKIHAKLDIISKSPWAALVKGGTAVETPEKATTPETLPGTVIASQHMEGRTTTEGSRAIH